MNIVQSGGMRRRWIILQGLVLAGIVACAVFRPAATLLAADLTNANEIMRRMYDAYGSCQTFSCKGEYEQATTARVPQRDPKTVDIRFARPAQLRLAWTEIRGGTGVVTNTIYMQGADLYFDWSALRVNRKEESLRMAIGGAAGISSGLSHTVPQLLLGHTEYLRLTDSKILGEVTIGGERCYRVKGMWQDRSMEVAISKQNFGLVQVKEHYTVDPAKIFAQLKAQGAPLPPRPVKAETFTVDATTTYSDIRFNPALKPGAFELHPKE